MPSSDKSLTCPFRVSHPNGDCIKGFQDLESAKDDARTRNARAKDLGLDLTYTAGAKP